MKKIIVILLIFFVGISCKEVETIQEIPAWLQEKINSYDGNCVYYGSKATRYKWRNELVYEITIPVSSCKMCDVYYSNGDSVLWSDSLKTTDFTSERTNKKILWQFMDDACLR